MNIWWMNGGLLQEFSNESAIKIVAAKSYTSSSFKRTVKKKGWVQWRPTLSHCLILIFFKHLFSNLENTIRPYT